MKTKQTLLIVLLNLSSILTSAQDKQSDALATSGGEGAGTTTSGAGGNTFYGYLAGNIGNIVGSTLIGSYSGADHNGDHNVFVGESSGQDGSGSQNTFIGTGSGNDHNGDQNTFIGNYAGGAGTGSGNICIGYNVGNDNQNKSNKLYIENSASATPLIWGDFAQDQLKFNAKVGVGYGFGSYPTTSGSVNVSNYNLFVKGGILTEEVRVSLANTWADYVFKKDYKLPTLQEVEKQIQEKGHLINVPSAEEVKNNGIELGEMSKIQQEKIEELTLYIIEQNKINEKQNKVIEQLTERLNKLENKKQ